MGFWRDAFGVGPNRPAKNTAALGYVRDVFGASTATSATRYFYGASCGVAYLACASLGILNAIRASGGYVPVRVLAWLYMASVAALAGGLVVSLYWRWRFGSLSSRHRRALKSLSAGIVAWAKEKPGEPEARTPWWWLYSVSVIAALENWPAFVKRAAGVLFTCVLFLTQYLMWVGIRGTWGLAFNWFLVLLWLVVGWLLPLDGLVKLAPWNGPGDFALATLRVGRRDYP